MKANEILGQFGFYTDADAGLREVIVRQARPVVLERGSYFFRAGQPCVCIPFVARGDVRVYLMGESSREITLYHVETGQSCLLTLNSALMDTPYTADAVVEEEVEALVVPVETFRQWFHLYEPVRQFVLEMMAQRITELMTLVSEVTFGRLDQRLADFLLRHFDQADAGNPVISMTHEHIAAELGTVREVISRVLKEFERKGAIGIRRGRIALQDPRLLESLK
jgi:CRP/FNR family transcriptional regulator